MLKTKKNILFSAIFLLGIFLNLGVFTYLGNNLYFNALVTENSPSSNTISTDSELFEEDQTSVLVKNIYIKNSFPTTIQNNIFLHLPPSFFTIWQPPRLV